MEETERKRILEANSLPDTDQGIQELRTRISTEIAERSKDASPLHGLKSAIQGLGNSKLSMSDGHLEFLRALKNPVAIEEGVYRKGSGVSQTVVDKFANLPEEMRKVLEPLVGAEFLKNARAISAPPQTGQEQAINRLSAAVETWSAAAKQSRAMGNRGKPYTRGSV